jgi:penicillin-binding protein 2
MSVLVEHGGFGAGAAAPRAREIMKVALLKDPEVRKRIEVPLPDIDAKPPPMPDNTTAGVDAVPQLPDLPTPPANPT